MSRWLHAVATRPGGSGGVGEWARQAALFRYQLSRGAGRPAVVWGRVGHSRVRTATFATGATVSAAT
jgi:hypothetical protein